jgi:TPR repeat protein
MREPDRDKLIHAYSLLEEHPDLAVREWKSLADAGSVSAMLHLGQSYKKGRGVNADPIEAERWYRLAATHGLTSAYYFLGRFLLDQKRYEDACDAFIHAARKHYPPALHYLGRMYFFGTGMPKDLKRSEAYLEEASARGNLFAKRLLARLLLENVSNPIRPLRGIWLLISLPLRLIYVLLTEGTKSSKFR